MTKTLGRGATRSQKSLTIFAAVALLASLITVYLPLPAQAAAGATYEFIFSNGEVLAGNTGGGDAEIPAEFFHDYYGGHESVPFDHHELSLHVSCSESFPGGWEADDGSFPDNPSAGGDSGQGDWHIASYTIERELGAGQIRNCGETFDPGSIKVVKHTDPETSEGFTFDLHGDIPPAPGTNGTVWSSFDGTQSVAGNDGMYTWTGLDVGEYTLSEDTGLNPTDYAFDSLTCSSDFSAFSYTSDSASASFDLHGGETVTCEFTNTSDTPPPSVPEVSVELGCQVTWTGSDFVMQGTVDFIVTPNEGIDSIEITAHARGDESITGATWTGETVTLQPWSYNWTATVSDGYVGEAPSGVIDFDRDWFASCTCPPGSIDLSDTSFLRADDSSLDSLVGEPASPVDIEEGYYHIYLASFDDHSIHRSAVQDNEIWSIANMEDGAGTFESPATDDLPSDLNFKSYHVTSGTGAVFVPGFDGADLWTVHAGAPADGPESVFPLCAQLVREVQPGQIIVDKQVTEGSDTSQAFDFDASYDGDGFSLSADDEPNNSGDLEPGSYSVSEDQLAGWTLESATCDDGSDPSNIDLDEGETVTCTFVNHEIQPGQIIVDKQVTEGSDTSQAFDFDASYDGDGFSLSADDEPNNSGDLEPGSYSVSEDQLAGWTLESATCDDGSDPSNIDLDEGETVTCTFVNHEVQPGTVTVIKNVVGDQSAEFAFTGDVAGTIGHNQSISVEADLNTVYSSSEVIPEGWELTDISCVADGGTFELGSSGVDMTVTEEDGSVVCTFTNGELPTITVVKQTLPVDAEDDTTFAFTGDLDGNLGDGDSTSATVEPGTYQVTETQVDNWELISIACDDGATGDVDNLTANYEVGYGDDITCTFTNVETEVLASVLVTVSGACIPDGDEGIGRITVNMSVDGAANVVVRDSDGEVVGSRSTSGTITVPEGATYAWEATANEGFEFPVDFDPTGEVTIGTCSEDEELPFTGLNTDTAVAIAALMLVAGLMMVRSTTRREES